MYTINKYHFGAQMKLKFGVRPLPKKFVFLKLS